MSSCFSRCLRVPIAMRRFYEQSLWIPQNFLFTNLDLHHGLLGHQHRGPRGPAKIERTHLRQTTLFHAWAVSSSAGKEDSIRSSSSVTSRAVPNVVQVEKNRSSVSCLRTTKVSRGDTG